MGRRMGVWGRLFLGFISLSLPSRGSDGASGGGASSGVGLSAYDQLVLAAGPVSYYPSGATDVAGGRHETVFGSPGATTMPNGDVAIVFDGTASQYVEIADHDVFSLPTTGILAIEAWMRPDVLQFSSDPNYVHWMGKGFSGQHEWVARMYNLVNAENRPNRISGYAFNLSGGLGVGSYFQDPVTAGEWIHWALVINTVDMDAAYATGYTKIYKNGILRDQDALTIYSIVPANGPSPVRIATRDLSSFFQGAIAKVAFYLYEVPASVLQSHTVGMSP